MGNDRGPALVVGASGGVGRAAAARLAEAGHDVAVVGRDERRLAEARAAVLDQRVRCAVIVADIADPGAPERVVADVRSELGDPVVLVNAAGMFGPLAPLAQTDPDEWARTVAVDVVAPYRFARAVLGPMLARGFGRIINVSSLTATGPAGTLNSAYTASKVALNRWTAVLARELEGTGVTANALHPGDLRTRMWEGIDAAASTADAADFRAWADRVRVAGDDPDAAAQCIVAIVHDSDAPTGIFFVVGNGAAPQDAQGLTWRQRLRPSLDAGADRGLESWKQF